MSDLDLTDIPVFLRRTPGDAKPPRTMTRRDTARALRLAQERGREERSRRARECKAARSRAMRAYRKIYGENAPDPTVDRSDASTIQRTVYRELLARERTPKPKK